MNHQGEYLITAVQPWSLLREAGTEDGAAAIGPSATDMDRSGQTGLIDLHSLIGPKVNGVELAAFSISDEADDTFGLQLWAWREGIYGPGVLVLSTAVDGCLIGTAKCAVHPTTGVAQASGLWCDTFSISDYWGGVTVVDSGRNGICRVLFDVRGYRYLRPHVFAADGSGTKCSSVGLIIAGY